MLGKCAGISIAWLTAFRLAEIGTFKGCPKCCKRFGIFDTALIKVSHKRRQIKSADVLGEMQGFRVIGSMGCYGFWVVIDTGNHGGTRLAVEPR